MVYSKPKHVGAFVIYFNVNFNVLKQINCALVGVIKDWISQNVRDNCGGEVKVKAVCSSEQLILFPNQ
jgi:hypothetical protein